MLKHELAYVEKNFATSSNWAIECRFISHDAMAGKKNLIGPSEHVSKMLRESIATVLNMMINQGATGQGNDETN